jgi:hypothetical protein
VGGSGKVRQGKLSGCICMCVQAHVLQCVSCMLFENMVHTRTGRKGGHVCRLYTSPSPLKYARPMGRNSNIVINGIECLDVDVELKCVWGGGTLHTHLGEHSRATSLCWSVHVKHVQQIPTGRSSKSCHEGPILCAHACLSGEVTTGK